jgi:hypothetical protein
MRLYFTFLVIALTAPLVLSGDFRIHARHEFPNTMRTDQVANQVFNNSQWTLYDVKDSPFVPKILFKEGFD